MASNRHATAQRSLTDVLDLATPRRWTPVRRSGRWDDWWSFMPVLGHNVQWDVDGKGHVCAFFNRRRSLWWPPAAPSSAASVPNGPGEPAAPSSASTSDTPAPAANSHGAPGIATAAPEPAVTDHTAVNHAVAACTVASEPVQSAAAAGDPGPIRRARTRRTGARAANRGVHGPRIAAANRRLRR